MSSPIITTTSTPIVTHYQQLGSSSGSHRVPVPPPPPPQQQQQQRHTVLVDDAFVVAAQRCGVSLDELKPKEHSVQIARPSAGGSSSDRRFHNAESLRARKIRMVLEERNHLLAGSPTKAPKPHPPSTLQSTTPTTTTTGGGGGSGIGRGAPQQPVRSASSSSSIASFSGNNNNNNVYEARQPPSLSSSSARHPRRAGGGQLPPSPSSNSKCLDGLIISALKRRQMRQLHSARANTVKHHIKEQEESRHERTRKYHSEILAASNKERYEVGTASMVNEEQKRSRSAREDQLRSMREQQEEERVSAELSRLQLKDEHISDVKERHALMLERKQLLLQRKHDTKLSSVINRRERMDASSPTRSESQQNRIEHKIQSANAIRESKLERVRGDAASVRVREEEAREKAHKLEKKRKREINRNIKMKALVSSDHQEVISMAKNMQLRRLADTSAHYAEIAQTKRHAQEGISQQRLEEKELKIQQAQEQKRYDLEAMTAVLAEENMLKDEWRRTLARKSLVQQSILSEEKEIEQQEKLEAAAARREFLTFQI